MVFNLSFVLVITTIMVAQASFTSAALVPKAALDVFDPTIISPDASTIWTIGQTELVTWDTSNAPEHISNGGLITLSGFGTFISPIDLHAGNMSIVVPDVTWYSHHHSLLRLRRYKPSL